AEGHARRFARASSYRFLGAVGTLSISRVVPRKEAPITRAGPLIGPNSGASVSGSRTATWSTRTPLPSSLKRPALVAASQPSPLARLAGVSATNRRRDRGVFRPVAGGA